MLIVCFMLITQSHSERLRAATLKKIRPSHNTLAYANTPFWIANDLGFFEEYGVDVVLNHVTEEKRRVCYHFSRQYP